MNKSLPLRPSMVSRFPDSALACERFEFNAPLHPASRARQETYGVNTSLPLCPWMVSWGWPLPPASRARQATWGVNASLPPCPWMASLVADVCNDVHHASSTHYCIPRHGHGRKHRVGTNHSPCAPRWCPDFQILDFLYNKQMFIRWTGTTCCSSLEAVSSRLVCFLLALESDPLV